MLSIGWRNLKSSPMRVAVAIGGITFAVVLVTCEIGMMFGMTRNASILVDRSSADLFVSSPNNKTFNFASPIMHRKRYQIESVPGVAHVEEFNAILSLWKLDDGGNAACQIIAFDLLGHLAPRLNMVAGNIRDLHNQNAVIIDESARKLLGNPDVGDHVEIVNSRAQIVGICRDMQSFSTIPMVFTSLRRGDVYGWARGNDANGGKKKSVYFMVQLAEGTDRDAVRSEILNRVTNVDVHTREGLSWKTRRFWLIETGMGLAFLFVAVLGLLVGGVILSQTLFALTMERLNEFGVLKALGAGMPEISRVVLEQGMICGCSGLILGLTISFGIREMAQTAGTEVEIGWILVTGVTLVALILSGCASLLSIARLRKLEPAMVFRT